MLLLRSSFIFMPYFLSPGQASLAGKHRFHSNENSLLLLLSTDDSFLITFGVGSGKDFLKTYGSSFCRTLGLMQPLLCARQYCVCIICLKNSEVGIVSFQKLYGQGSWGGSAG